MKKIMWSSVGLTVAFLAGFAARDVMPGQSVALAQAPRVFELRTYTAGDGKLDLLHARFRNHTQRIFKKHGMTSVWYGKPMDAPLSQNTMVYMLAYPTREAATKGWADFRADTEWAAIAKESGVGPVKVDSVFLEPTDYSPMK